MDREYLKTLLKYDAETGSLIWLPRGTSLAVDKIFNAQQFIGSAAGCIKNRLHKGKGLYLELQHRRKVYLVHRLVWIYFNGPIPDGLGIDHIDGDGLNNRIENLRVVSQFENMKNMRRRRDNKSGITGVCKTKSGKWAAQIMAKSTCKYLGTFTNKSDAVAARKAAESKYGFHENHGAVRKDI